MVFDLNLLHCYGCAHSASSEPYPGKPSGERPCCFCIRSGQPVHPTVQVWYDGSKPVRVPMDCYQTLDMKKQVAQWMETAQQPADVSGPQ